MNVRDDYIAYRNNDIHYFISGQCKAPRDIFELSVIYNDLELLDIMYLHYRYCVNLEKIIDSAIELNKKHIVIYLYKRDVMFSENAVINTALYGNKDMLEWCLNISTVMTGVNKGRFADAIFKGGLDTTNKNSKLGILIHRVLK
jgi:hypothetical protein